MKLVKIVMSHGESGATRLTEPVATDLIWSHAEERDAVEHVRVRIEADLMTVVLFIRAADDDLAREHAANVAERAVKAPAMTGWTIKK